MKEKLSAAAGAVGRHKKVLIFLVIAAIAAFAVWNFVVKPRLTKDDAVTYSFVRTTTLRKSTLENSVSATGTVESDNVSTVSTTLKYAISEVFVQVGDEVKEGDVIAKLDTETLQKQIDRAKENVQDAVERAQDSYDKAVKDYNEAVEDKDEAQSDYDDADDEYDDAKDDYNSAKSKVSSFQDDADKAESAMKKALKAYNKANDTVQSKQSKYDKAETNYNKAVESGDESKIASTKEKLDAAEAALDEAKEECSKLEAAYDEAADANDEAQKSLSDKQSEVNYYSLESEYESKKNAREQAETALDNAKDKVEDAKEKVDDAKKDLEDAGKDDDLDDLYDELDDCTLVAQSSGTVTSVNATVGAVAEGTLATIQDTEDLIISITISEDDVRNVTKGMPCYITTDATEGTINGTLSMISPTSSTSNFGNFSAEVTVEGGSNGLLIGMNASVEIVQSSTDDVFTVPYDAVGEDDKGSFVYYQTGGEGVDATFDKVYVTVGDSNDYYVEISGDDLKEGMTIRSSSDLTQGIDTITTGGSDEDSDSSALDGMFGGMGGGGGGGMPGGGMGGGMGGGGMPSGGGGGMPSGGGGGFPG